MATCSLLARMSAATDLTALAAEIEELYERATSDLGEEAAATVEEALALLDDGSVRVAAPTDTGWHVNEWAKKAILLSFRTRGMETIEVGPYEYHDKMPLKSGWAELGVRVVPPATARQGAYVAPGVVLMPSYVNVGAWVGSGTMVDTWATVGSCAQIGTDVHLSGGVGIGGVLEPLQASPVIVEDGAFVGSRCIVVEGVRVGREAVLGANVVLTASTPIIDVRGKEPVELRGEVPPRAIVIPGHAQEEVPGRHLPHPVRAHHRRAQRLDRPQDLTDRGAARARRSASDSSPRVDRHRPAGQVDVEVLPHLDLELAAVEPDRDRRVAAAQDVGDGRAARAGAARGASPPTPRSKIRARMVASSSAVNHETFVRCGNCGSVSIGGPMAARSSASRVRGVGDVDRRLRVADDQVLEAEAVRLARVAQRCAPHVDAAGRVGEDRRADLPRGGLDRELARVGPAGAAQVQDRLRARRCRSARPPSRRG